MIKLYQNLWQKLTQLDLNSDAIAKLKELTENKLYNPVQGDYPRWLQAYKNLVEIEQIKVDLTENAITCASKHCSQAQKQQIELSLQQLIPWRKGPFNLFDIYIDAEWQSYMKWNRIAENLPILTDRRVLDVGCGNGYYLMKMAASKPRLLLGIEPGILQLMQFWAVEKYAKSQAYVLPLIMHDLPQKMEFFDVVFSMGVLYHRKSPLQHIRELAECLKAKGKLILETLVIDGDEKTCLIPQNRYAQMRNVWFLPSIKMLSIMLQRNGFKNIQVIDVTTTTTQEQRTTAWMPFHSLKNFLNKEQTKTIEGYDLPKRATLIAEKKYS